VWWRFGKSSDDENSHPKNTKWGGSRTLQVPKMWQDKKGENKMTAYCPHCDTPLVKQRVSKLLAAIEYHCPHCGQHWTKVKGERTYHKGQTVNLPQRYFKKGG